MAYMPCGNVNDKSWTQDGYKACWPRKRIWRSRDNNETRLHREPVAVEGRGGGP